MLTVECGGWVEETKMLTVVDGRKGGWVESLQNVDGC